jgi:hypothetical protein
MLSNLRECLLIKDKVVFASTCQQNSSSFVDKNAQFIRRKITRKIGQSLRFYLAPYTCVWDPITCCLSEMRTNNSTTDIQPHYDSVVQPNQLPSGGVISIVKDKPRPMHWVFNDCTIYTREYFSPTILILLSLMFITTF